MDAYLNTISEDTIIFDEILNTFVIEQLNVETFERSASADIYKFTTQQDISKLVELYLKNNEKITLAEIQEVAPGLVELIEILNIDYIDSIESANYFIDEFLYNDEASPSDYFLGEWKNLNMAGIINYISKKSPINLVVFKNDTVFYNYKYF